MATMVDTTVGSPGINEPIGTVEETKPNTVEGCPSRNEALGVEGEMDAIAGGRRQPRAEIVAGGTMLPISAVVMLAMADAKYPSGRAMDDAVEGRIEERPGAAKDVESMSKKCLFEGEYEIMTEKGGGFPY